MHRIAHSMYVKLNDISEQLEHEPKVLHECNDNIEKDLKLAQRIQQKLISNKIIPKSFCFTSKMLYVD